MTIRLCLFDLDDTLVMTSDLAQFRGAENVNNTSAIYKGAIENAFSAYPDRHMYTPAILNKLRASHPETKWGVFTRAPRVYAQLVLRLAYPTIKWDVVVAREDVRHTKPNAEGIHLAMKQIGVQYIDETMMVGDSKSDIMAAYHAGTWVTLDQSGWPKSRVYENWRCLERLPDATISRPDMLNAVLKDPSAHMPLLDRLAHSGGTPSIKNVPARLEKINHFRPKDMGQGTYTIHCLGRMFGAYESLSNRSQWHELTKQIIAHKDATSFPDAWLFACRRFLAREFALGMDSQIVFTVIPAKPGRTKRLEAFLGQLKADIQANPIPLGRIEFVPDVLQYGPGARSHHGEHLSKQQRFENVRDNLSVANRTIIKGKTVVVLDDVVTTGASLIYAYTYLAEAGAKQVTCVALTKAIGDG
jgi:phosphoglycolate phosphatase-like HAD superfamily hydrolase